MKVRRSTLALLGAIVWVTASLVGVSLASTARASTAPVVHVSTEIAEIGQLIYITGSGWSPVGQTVEIELCGQNARNLSSDCDQSNQYSAAIRPGGIFYGALTVRPPPTPCPCVVEVANQGSFSGQFVPIRIIGAPSVAIPPQAAPTAPVALSARVLTPVSVSAWFGGPKAITFVLRVTNVSLAPSESPTLTVNVGKGPKPNGFVLGKPLDPLAVGATRVLRIPVTIPAFTAGHYSVRAQVITSKGPVAIIVGTSSYPWGLIAVGLIVLLLLGLVLWRRMRRRRRIGRLPPPGPGDGPGNIEPDQEFREVART